MVCPHRVQGPGSKVQDSGFRVQGAGFRVQGAGFRDEGPGFRVQGSGFRFQGSGLRVGGCVSKLEELNRCGSDCPLQWFPLVRQFFTSLRLFNGGRAVKAPDLILIHEVGPSSSHVAVVPFARSSATLDPEPSTLNLEHSAVNPAPPTLSPQP